MKYNSKADVSNTDEFDKMYKEMVKQAEDKYKVKSEHPKTEEEAKDFAAKVLRIKEEIAIPDNYEVWDDKGNVISTSKIIIREKKKAYPKTYEECCKVLNVAVRDLDILDNMLDTTEIIYNKNLDRLLNSFRKLYICRDAYWKIAGEEMGLGKPWSPNWYNDEKKYTIEYYNGEIIKDFSLLESRILVFPTEEMRDAFYENFKEEIEACKELL